MIRLAIADDHCMVREGFRRIVEAHADMEIVGEAARGEEIPGLLEGCRPDVLLLDISMPGPGFLTTMSAVKEGFPRTRVLVVSMHAEEHWAFQALKAGADGYLTKARSAEELAEGIRRVHRGRKYITSELAECLALNLGSGRPASPEALSLREFEVLRQLGAGKMVKTVARELGISPKTVSTYRFRLLKKLGLSSTADLIRYAVDHRLVD